MKPLLLCLSVYEVLSGGNPDPWADLIDRNFLLGENALQDILVPKPGIFGSHFKSCKHCWFLR